MLPRLFGIVPFNKLLNSSTKQIELWSIQLGKDPVTKDGPNRNFAIFQLQRKFPKEPESKGLLNIVI